MNSKITKEEVRLLVKGIKKVTPIPISTNGNPYLFECPFCGAQVYAFMCVDKKIMREIHHNPNCVYLIAMDL